MIADRDRRELLALAREAIAASLTHCALPQASPEGDLAHAARVFVTLHTRGQLRGCIGQLDADRPLAAAVQSCAVSAATADPRFHAVSGRELDEIDIEISVLGELEPVRELADIEVGRHGLLVESGWRRGLLLPQVAAEWGWEAATFVAHTCRKAGLPPDAWPARGALLFRFEAEVFGDRGIADCRIQIAE
jgi:uncharacterized protein